MIQELEYKLTIKALQARMKALESDYKGKCAELELVHEAHDTALVKLRELEGQTPANPKCAQCQTPNSCGGDGRCLEDYIAARLKQAAPTARTYMDGYSDGKAWALWALTDAETDALWADGRLTIPQFNVRRRIARAVEAALGEGL